MPNNQELVDEFYKETGKYYYDTSMLDFAWSDDYVRWLEIKEGVLNYSKEDES